MSTTRAFALPFGSSTKGFRTPGPSNGGTAGAQGSALVGGQQAMRSQSTSKPWYTPAHVRTAANMTPSSANGLRPQQR